MPLKIFILKISSKHQKKDKTQTFLEIILHGKNAVHCILFQKHMVIQQKQTISEIFKMNPVCFEDPILAQVCLFTDM